jgi:hypothetical protein
MCSRWWVKIAVVLSEQAVFASIAGPQAHDVPCASIHIYELPACRFRRALSFRIEMKSAAKTSIRSWTTGETRNSTCCFASKGGPGGLRYERVNSSTS